MNFALTEILSLLDLETLKNCRSVCQKWRQLIYQFVYFEFPVGLAGEVNNKRVLWFRTDTDFVYYVDNDYIYEYQLFSQKRIASAKPDQLKKHRHQYGTIVSDQIIEITQYSFESDHAYICHQIFTNYYIMSLFDYGIIHDHVSMTKYLCTHLSLRDITDHDNYALRCAVYHGHTEIVELLTDLGARLPEKYTELIRRISENKFNDIKKILIKYAADYKPYAVNAIKFNDMETLITLENLSYDFAGIMLEVFHDAILANHLDAVKFMIRHGLKSVVNGNTMMDGFWPIGFGHTVSRNYYEMAELLIDCPGVATEEHLTNAFKLAVQNGHVESIKMLIKYHNYEIKFELINSVFDNHLAMFRFLHEYTGTCYVNEKHYVIAINKKDLEMIKYLLSLSKVQMSDHLLSRIYASDCPEIMELFWIHIDPEMLNRFLEKFVNYGKCAILSYLVDKKFSFSNLAREKIAEHVVKHNNVELLEIFYESLNIDNIKTVIPVLLECNFIEVPEWLCLHGLSLTEIGFDFESVIKTASKKGYLNVVKLLLKNGLTLEHIRVDHNYPILLAAIHGHLEIVKIFHEQGVMVNEMQFHDGNLLDFAVTNNHFKIVKYFCEIGLKCGNARHANLKTIKYLHKKGSLDLTYSDFINNYVKEYAIENKLITISRKDIYFHYLARGINGIKKLEELGFEIHYDKDAKLLIDDIETTQYCLQHYVGRYTIEFIIKYYGKCKQSYEGYFVNERIQHHKIQNIIKLLHNHLTS